VKSMQSAAALVASSLRKAQLLVIIDTEEEFDWSKGFSRSNTSVRHMGSIGVIQKIFSEYGITPVYVVNYPVASQPDGYLPLLEILQSGRCVIGAHMHPWVTPPFDEEVCTRNSFPGNLPPALESAKLDVLCKCIEQSFGITPKIFKAGRYGLGPNTLNILEEHDFEVDVSVCPYTDFSGQEGPDFTNQDSLPFWHGIRRRLLEIPLTVEFEGRIRQWGPRLYPKLSGSLLKKAHIPGIFSRLGLLNRVVLSPEGSSINELKRLVRALHRDGTRIFSFAFHSPSVEPGHTPYVKTAEDLSNFLLKLRQFFDFFFEETGGQSSTPEKIRDAALASRSFCSPETL
jgi:hypothetical protein